MKNDIFLSYQNIFSALGSTSQEVVTKVSKGESGLKSISDTSILPIDFYASVIEDENIDRNFKKLGDPEKYTKLEKMMIISLSSVINSSHIELKNDVGLIISTTKGNIDTLDKNNPFPEKRAYLAELGKVVTNFFGFEEPPIILSNACVSGLLAIGVAKKLIKAEKYNHVFIVSGDLVSRFVMAGFNSFQALSPEICQPYSAHRKGINLGEAAASTLITSSTENLAKESIKILGEATCNDANHISGPSRTGEGLYRSIKRALKEAHKNPKDIDYISAHGTATAFNDEMEAIAFDRANLNKVPLNSLKAYFGHTLGASGLIETIVGMHSLANNILYASKGFDVIGVSKPIHILKENKEHNLNCFLKTASGFGGCNTAAIFQKVKI